MKKKKSAAKYIVASIVIVLFIVFSAIKTFAERSSTVLD